MRAPRAPAEVRAPGAAPARRRLDDVLSGLVDTADDLVHARDLAQGDDRHGKQNGTGCDPGEGGARAQVEHGSPVFDFPRAHGASQSLCYDVARRTCR